MPMIRGLLVFVLLAISLVAQEFSIKWVDSTKPDGQVSVNQGKGFWEDYAEGGGSGTVKVDGNDLILKDKFGNDVAVIKGGANAATGDTGNVELGTSSIGQWECVEF